MSQEKFSQMKEDIQRDVIVNANTMVMHSIKQLTKLKHIIDAFLARQPINANTILIFTRDNQPT